MAKVRQTQVALVTSAQYPQLTIDDQALISLLAQRRIVATPEVWDNRAAIWSQYSLVVIRSTWDYPRRRAEFLAWADQVTRFANPPQSIVWNSDKHYLVELAEMGIPTVPTTWMEPDQRLSGQRLHTRFPAHGDFVLKPAVSGGRQDTGRYTANDSYSRGLAIQHALRLLNSGRAVMLQRYVSTVDELGERALIYFAGQYSHAVFKGAMLTGPDTGESGIHQTESMTPATPTAAELKMGEKTLDMAAKRLGCDRSDFTYARVDLVTDNAGTPMLMELELIEPALFMGQAPGSADRFADAIVSRVR